MFLNVLKDLFKSILQAIRIYVYSKVLVRIVNECNLYMHDNQCS